MASPKRYAQAIFEIAVDNNDLDGWVKDLTLLAQKLDDSQVASFLDAPQIPSSKKIELLRNSIGSEVGSLAANLMFILASQRTVSILPKILDDYQDMLDSYRGFERATVTSAVPLKENQTKDITSYLTAIVQKDVSVSNKIDPGILGGFIARVGDRVLDGSSATKLHQMKKSLSQ